MTAAEFVEIDRQRMSVRRIGRWTRDEPVLVFLHEGLGSISMWRDFPDALAAATGLPALIYDRLGHGRSAATDVPRPAEFLDIEAQRVLPSLLAATGTERPFLVGHSDGGTIALLYAAAFPDLALACITEAAHVMMEHRTRDAVAAVAERYAKDAHFRSRLSHHHDSPEPLVRGWAEAWLRWQPGEWDILGRLARITCPVLAIQGGDDEHGTAAQVDAIVGGVRGPAEDVIIPGCGHAPHHEARDAVLGCMTRFIAGVLSESGMRPSIMANQANHDDRG